MKKQLLILVLALFAGIGFYSCKKKYQVIPAPTPTSSIRDSFDFIYNENRQNFTLNGLIGGSFTTDKGIVIAAPGYAFRDANNDTVLGNINVEIIEILTTSDMIFMNKSTTSNGDVLVTGGQFKITFTVNDNPVFISPDTSLIANVPTDIGDNNMQVFNGEEDATGFVNWTQALDSVGMPVPAIITQDTVQNVIQKYYSFPLDNINSNWINCDYFYNVPGAKTKLAIALPEIHNNSNTLFFIHFDNIQSVMTGYFDGNNFVTAGQIPVGTDVSLIFVSEIDGDYMYKDVDVTVSNGFSTTITLDPSTYNDIIEDIEDL